MNTTNAATLLNILQAALLTFVHGLSFDGDVCAEDAADARDSWARFLGCAPGDEYILDGHRLVVQ